jgi:hypothetical protein
MWEWVEEFQAKQATKPRFRSDSIEVALLGSTRALNARDADVLIKDAILEMTRDDFDQILTEFQLYVSSVLIMSLTDVSLRRDMQDKTSIKDSLEQRFSWRTFSSEPLPDRKAFDAACQRYDEWLASETQKQLGYGSSSNISGLPVAEGEELAADASLWNTAHSTRLPRQLSSCEQLSRAMRVFLAWKAPA